MSIEAIEAIEALQPFSMNAVEQTGKVNSPFSTAMIEKIDDVNESLRTADKVIQDLVLDKPVAAHDVMLAMQQARSELKMAVEVRNKILEAYQEILRMQV